MNAIYALAGVVAYLYAFWALYVMVMGLYRAYLSQRLHGLNAVLAVPFVAIGYLVDLIANFTIAWAFFLDPPREALVTSRLIRYKKTETTDSWRYQVAHRICEGLLDVFDPTGDHC